MAEPGVARKRKRSSARWRWPVITFAAMAIAAVGAFWLSQRVLPGASFNRSWSALSGTPVRNDFVYLMFPGRMDVPVYDAPGGKQIGILERAVGNSQGELEGGKWVSVPRMLADGSPGFVLISDLIYLSPATIGRIPAGERPPNYIKGLYDIYREREPGRRRGIQFQLRQGIPEEVKEEARLVQGLEGRFVTLRLEDIGNRQDFHAFVTPDKAIPLAEDTLYAGARAWAKVARWGIGGAVAALAAAAVWVGCVVVRVRIEASQEHREPA
ncbi:MAG: hypothetical protein QM783_07835 [Phycisphaerales bacterium]